MAGTFVANQTISERYVLQDSLGKGGMGVVWRAQDLLLQRPVAIKEIRIPATVSDHEHAVIEERAIREARAAASINHSNAVSVFDVLSDQGRIFIVMELIDAPTLARVVAVEGALTAERAASIGLQILDALEIAHAKGIVHRDVKPANVMVGKDDTVKLADFGIASVKGDPRLTASGMILGSPGYMAPEQAQEAIATAASDIWSLGATLYLAIEGRGPFDKGQPIPTLTAVISDEPKFTARSGGLRTAIEACLSKDPADRPTTVQLRRMLQAVGRPETAAASSPATSPAAPTPAPTAPSAIHPAGADTSLRWWSHPRGWILGVLALAVVGGISVAALTDSTPRKPEDAGNAGGNAAADAGNAGNRKEAAGSVPEGWTSYTDESTGYLIGYPDGWEIETGNGTARSVDFVDPDTGAYLRVDWTDTPGDSPQAAWESYEVSFEGGHENYRRIRMDPTTFQGYDASHWEYTWGSGLHAVNLGFVTGEYGFALNYQAPEDAWRGLQDVFNTFKETFVAP